RTFSVLLARDEPPGEHVPGSIEVADGDRRHVVFRVDPAAGSLSGGLYRMTLFGAADLASGRPAIADESGQLLDGDPVGLPSGSGRPGTSFVFKIVVE